MGYWLRRGQFARSLYTHFQICALDYDECDMISEHSSGDSGHDKSHD